MADTENSTTPATDEKKVVSTLETDLTKYKVGVYKNEKNEKI